MGFWSFFKKQHAPSVSAPSSRSAPSPVSQEERDARERKVREAIASFPKTFGLRDFPGEKFYIHKDDSSWHPRLGVYLFLESSTIDKYVRRTPEELREDIVYLDGSNRKGRHSS